jgi:pSer/pThr/pTyr-binding forkhead associated (FHA) protein
MGIPLLICCGGGDTGRGCVYGLFDFRKTQTMIKIQIFANGAMIREEAVNSGLREFFIGRRPHHFIHLDDIAVSKDHAHISISNTLILEDLKSSNGTLLNGMPISRPVALNPNDTIQIAEYTLRIQDKRNIDSSEAETTTWLVNTQPKGNDPNEQFQKTGFFSYKDFLKQRDENQ